MQAVEIYLDQDSEDRVRAIWAALDARGVQSLGSVPDTDYRPHVSLAVFREGDDPRICAVLAPALQPYMGMPLTMASLGWFPTAESVAFLSVTPTHGLLEANAQVHAALDGVAQDAWAYYRPGNFVPHCTLALGSQEAATILEVLREYPLPIKAVARESHLVEISTGTSLTLLA